MRRFVLLCFLSLFAWPAAGVGYELTEVLFKLEQKEKDMKLLLNFTIRLARYSLSLQENSETS